MDLWRGEAYSKFFEFLDDTGGFYYEVSSIFTKTALLLLTIFGRSVGVTRQFTASVRRCSPARTRSTSSATLGTNTRRIRIAPETTANGWATSARVILATTSVRALHSRAVCDRRMLKCQADYDGVSCMPEWDRFQWALQQRRGTNTSSHDT